MTPRIRHCVECPKCHTRYLVGFSPYRNGSYLMPLSGGPLGRCGILGRVDSLLFLRQATHSQSMELERVESICGLESSSRSRLWFTRGDCAGTREVAVLGLELSRVRPEKLSNLHPTNSSLVRKRPRSVELTRTVRCALLRSRGLPITLPRSVFRVEPNTRLLRVCRPTGTNRPSDRTSN